MKMPAEIDVGKVVRSTAMLIALGAIPVMDAVGATPPVKITDVPLFSGGGNVHPNMLLSLSVEFPTAGIAYRSDNGTYNRNYEYVGYFNPLMCYAYTGGNRNVTSGYFSILKPADTKTHECGGGSFSGNFMNWASSSAIDMLRYALTGGDRVVDTPGTTILQRAVLKESFYADEIYFPRRSMTAGGNVSAPNQVTPFNVDRLYVVSCRNRILFSDSKSSDGNCDTSAFDTRGVLKKTDKKLGEYLVRVKVCDAADAASRADLCQKYGSNFKPVGQIQRHADKIRFAAMGYLLDDSATRYGGVLRAPMKYVGAKKFDAPSFSEIANDKPEWDAETGVFYNNPENPSDRHNAAINSGVINYVNKFGRSGIYKSLEPLSELYYEGIRYLQGKQPTPDATAGMTESMKDGFPVLQSWTDPVIASCQKNYIVSIADVNSHWDRYVPGNQRTTYNNGLNANDPTRVVEAGSNAKTSPLDVKFWTRKVGEMEADANGLYANPAPRSNLSDLDARDTGSDGHGTYYMAGLAYWANTNDIRPDKSTRVKTFVVDVDEDGNGQVNGNTRALKPRDSQLYLAAKYGGFEDRNNDGNPFVTTASDGRTILRGVNSEWDGNGNGVPANYFLASQPKVLIQSIRKIFSNVGSSSGSLAGVAVSSNKILSDGAFIYQPSFDSSKWTGNLRKIKLALDEGTKEIKIESAADWDVSGILTGVNGQAASPSPDARNIYTAKIKTDQSLETTEFRWDKLSNAQQTLLNASPIDGKTDGLGEQRVNYLRGARDLEIGHDQGIFRTRDRLLGDIVNSNPTYVGAPAMYVQGAGYQKFYDTYKDRTKAVYVGANDGMLHAFSALDGRELFAYIPNALISKLNQLTAPEYVHRPYVDGGMSVAEARVAGRWKTILASGMGGGAQGVFALDVTNPSDFGGGRGALWEFTDSDDADMGNVMGIPLVAKFRTEVVAGIPEYKYFVVVPSGLNNYMDDDDHKFNAAASGVLFLLSLDKSPTEKWKRGVNYYKFTLPIQDANQQNGLSTPALTIGLDGAVRYAYVGDLQGNLWSLKFTENAPWSSALSSTSHKPLFTAMDANGNRQPITVQPKVVFAPGGGYVVLFGTGKFVEDADVAPGNFKTQSFYGIYDPTVDDYRVVDRSQLAARKLVKNGADGSDAVLVSGNDFNYGLNTYSKRGWYFDFLDAHKTGERSVTNPVVSHGRIFFNTVIPGGDPCVPGGGRSYAVGAITGLPFVENTTGFLSNIGLLGAPVLFESGVPETGGRNAIGRRAVKRKYTVFNVGTGGAKGMAEPARKGSGEVAPLAGRLSWRELLNWQELRATFNKK